MHRFLTLLLLCTLPASCGRANEDASKNKRKATNTHLGPWVEADFPFFSSVLDARNIGSSPAKDNLIPRGIILNLGNDYWACFDPDLVRLACLWKGEGVSPSAMAPGTYVSFGWKTKPGQSDLPIPLGTAWLSSHSRPQWQALKSLDEKPTFPDTRTPAPSAEEIGRGAIDPALDRFDKVEITKSGVQLHYEVAGTAITEHFFVTDGDTIIRQFTLAPADEALALSTEGLEAKLQWELLSNADQPAPQTKEGYILFPISSTARTFSLVYSDKALPKEKLAEATQFAKTELAPLRWPEVIEAKGSLSSSDAAFVTDNIPLPLENPWKRDVRLADIGFLNDKGKAALVTFDGDVWVVEGLQGDLTNIRWKRYTSGLHEPMSLVVKEGIIYVFDRNGIWKLLDTDGNGEADTHELFCNLIAQTAETREFPNSMELAPDGSFVISKGGQQGVTLGKHNGSVLRISPDGKTITMLGHGFRQPFIGVHPTTGLVTASDQQGEYVPSTPLHIVRDNQFYGHLATIQPKEQYPEPIADPLAWIPHPVNPSAISQVWLVGAKMGPLTDECIHIGYNRPEIFRVLINERFKKPQASVLPLSRDLNFSPLNGTVNPADGQLYLTGFQSWGTTAKDISGLVRYRFTNKPRVLLKELTPMDKGVLLHFNEPLDDKTATDSANYTIERWNYKRTAAYGSPHLKLDGSAGQEWMTPSSVYLSTDKKSVFIGIPDMRPVMQMRVGWGVKSAAGHPAENNAYTTPYELAAFDSAKEGFGNITVDLTPKKSVAVVEVKPTLEEGKRTAEMFGCMACHSIDGNDFGKVGPSWKGIYGSTRLLKDGKTKVTADEEYLHESIVNPPAKVVKGFEKFDAGMPIYAGILNESQIQSVILYIKSLK